jgi:hypothetical protein
MEFVYNRVDSVTVRNVAGDSLAMLHHIAPVTGGEPVYLLPDGTAAAAVARHGRGNVVAMCGADNFSDAVLGTTSAVPDEPTLALYRIEFELFETFMGRTLTRAANDPH